MTPIDDASRPDSLAPVDQREVSFYEDRVVAVLMPGTAQLQPTILVPVRPICEQLGLAWSGQYERIQRDPVLSDVTQGVRVTRTPEEGGAQNMLCLPIDYLNGWLFKISAARVKAESRDKLIRYQRECYRTLWEAFRPDVLGALATGEASGQVSDDVAHVRLAVDGMLDYLWRSKQHDEIVRSLLEMVRLDVHEVGGFLEEGSALTARQRKTLYALGLEVAVLLGQAGERRNPYAIVFGGLKKRFDLGKKHTYHEIPRDKYREAHEFLAHWKSDAQRKIRENGEEPCIL